jgi:group I intron endonuclease
MAIPARQIGIYKITSPSGKVYIGQSWDIQGRFSKYKSLPSVKKQKKLYNSLVKYSWKNHIFEIIKHSPEDITQKELDNLEIYYIKSYKDSGIILLNIKEGGSGGKLPKSSIDKMLITRGKWNHTEETKLKISNSHKGILHSTETKLKLSNVGKTRFFSDITKKRISETYKRKIALGEIKIISPEINKKIILDLITGIFYIGVVDAANTYSFKTATLRKKLNGQLKNNTNLKYV